MPDGYLKNLKGRLSYIDLISYCLANFEEIRKVDDVVSKFQTKVFDVTDTPEQHMIRSMEETYPGERDYSLIFQEDDRFSGVIDLDFIDDALANFRAQLFAKGFFSSSKMNKKYDTVLEFIMKKYGKGIDRLHVYDKTWHDENRGLFITLRKVKGSPKPSISFTIVDEKFSGLATS
ncbi:MAG: hypothetical protein HQ588_01435 [Deltaproteobacteria bacterium]|nr:hypothetical protein [Deltaproteobacteria bacterium]